MTSASDAIREAMRLTGRGKVAEATERLRTMLGSTAGTAAPREEGSTGVTIDMTPPGAGSGTWTAPHAAADGAQADRAHRPSLAGIGKLGVLPSLRSLVGQIERVGADLGIAGARKSGGAAPARDARFVERNYADAAGQRRYKLYTPGAASGELLPLVVMLHGCTQSPDDFALGTGMNRVGEERSFFVAYPEQTQQANAARCWNWFQPGDQQRDRGEPALIAGIIREIVRDHPVDPERIYIAGLSAGGAAAANMASLYPELFAAYGVHSGLPCGAARDLPSALQAMKQGSQTAPAAAPTGGLPVIVFHGDRDQVVNPANAERIVPRSANLTERQDKGATGGRAYSVVRQTDAAGSVVSEQWTLHGAGHAWSGGDPAGSYTAADGPDASREMARFFLLHRKQAKAVRS